MTSQPCLILRGSPIPSFASFFPLFKRQISSNLQIWRFLDAFPGPKKAPGAAAPPTLPGRWGAASSSEPPAAAPAAPAGDARLMPFLVQAAEAPSYASVALVKPESTGSHRWTKKEDGLGRRAVGCADVGGFWRLIILYNGY